MYSFYPMTEGIIFAQTSFALHGRKKNCLLWSEHYSAFTWKASYFLFLALFPFPLRNSHFIETVVNREAMLLCSLLPLTKSRAAMVQSLWTGSSSLLQAKWIVKAESSLVSMEKDGKLCIPAQHMFRDSFFLFLSGFFLPSMTSSRLLLCLKPPFGYILSLFPSKRLLWSLSAECQQSWQRQRFAFSSAC